MSPNERLNTSLCPMRQIVKQSKQESFWFDDLSNQKTHQKHRLKESQDEIKTNKKQKTIDTPSNERKGVKEIPTTIQQLNSTKIERLRP